MPMPLLLLKDLLVYVYLPLLAMVVLLGCC